MDYKDITIKEIEYEKNCLSNMKLNLNDYLQGSLYV